MKTNTSTRSNRFPIRRGRLIWIVCLLFVLLLPQCMRLRMSDEKVAAYFANRPEKPSFGFVNGGGHSVHYASVGADSLPIVLFIHGSPGAWDAFIDFLADSTLYRHARLISADRPGFGKSELGHAEPSLMAQAAALEPLLRLNKAAHKPILVGHSLGGPVAVRMAMDFPDEIGGLILVAPSISAALEPHEWYRPVGNAFPIRYWLPVELRVSNQEILPLKKELDAMMPYWSKIRVPVIVIQGNDDDLVAPGNAAFAKKMLVNAPVNIEMIPQMNHFIPWRRPDLIHGAILTQLTNQ